MSNTQLIILGVGVVIIVGGVWALTQNDPTVETTPTTEKSSDEGVTASQDEGDKNNDAEVVTQKQVETDTQAPASEPVTQTNTTPEDSSVTTGDVDNALSEIDSLLEENYDDSSLDAYFDESEATNLTESYGI